MDINEKEYIDRKESIGTQKEKSVHRYIKYLLSSDINNHEYKIENKIVDCFINNNIYEIQTRNFSNLRDKLNKLLDNYKFTICYPFYSIKKVSYVNEDGITFKSRLSPKKEYPWTILAELYRIVDYLKHSNLSIRLYNLEVLELQKDYINKYKRLRKTPIDKIPIKVIDVFEINNYKDIIKLLPNQLYDISFTQDIFNKYTHFNKRNGSYALQVLKKLNLVNIIGKDNKKYLYSLKND